MTQYLDMLRNSLSTRHFDESIPGISSLISDYGLEPSVAFTIHRAGITRAMAAHDAVAKTEKTNSSVLDGNLEMTDIKAENIAGQETAEDGLVAEDNAISKDENAQAESLRSPDTISKADTEPTTATWHPVLQTLMKQLKPVLSHDFDESMSLPFFVTFWQLSLHDMLAPSSSYNAEIERQKSKIAAINADRSDVSTAGVAKKEAQKKVINDLLDRLREEMKAHILTYQNVRNRLTKEKDQWYAGFTSRFSALNARILQECFLPRLLLSPLDSFFHLPNALLSTWREHSWFQHHAFDRSPS